MIMPSPFPGMNPFLEVSVWNDFHHDFLTATREALVKQLVPRYIVKIDEHVFFRETPQAEKLLVGRGDGERQSSTLLLEAPAQVELVELAEEQRWAFLEIRDRQDFEVITVVELLSPSNKKPGPDRDRYLDKRRHLLNSPIHFVEIDLLRGWGRMPMPKPPASDYCVLVSRAEDRPKAGVWPINLRDPLPPVIPVPVRQGDADASLNLKLLLDRVYDTAGYDYYIYGCEPQPALSAEDAAWVKQFVPGKS
jgi:hypothetical protein